MDVMLKSGGQIQGIILGHDLDEDDSCSLEDVFRFFCGIKATAHVYGEAHIFIDNGDPKPVHYVLKEVK